MKASASKELVQAQMSGRRRSLGLKGAMALPALLLAMMLSGCSSFDRDWRRAARLPTAPGDIAARWEGSWISEVNGHNGSLRCLLKQQAGNCYHARFQATYAKVLRFSYAVPLIMQTHDGGWEFNGEANLGKLAGGNYYYEGRIGSTNFFSTYKSDYDHGNFQMHSVR